ncbi:MAG: DUF4065 domain-containing protein [Planctomycetes bacterium]|nr:DUF4065 domain-containing protein [Planctomycetota bacterium]
MPEAQTVSPDEKKRRLRAAALGLLSGAQNRRLMATSLNKALFYLDLAVLRDTGRTLTRNTYIALEQGPVISGYQKRLLRDLPAMGLADFEEDDVHGYRSKTLVLRDSAEIELPELLLELAARIGRRMSQATAKKVSDTSHDNPGWQQAWDAGGRSGGAPEGINMLLALQQVADSDPWLSDEDDGEFLEALDVASAREGAAWL